MYLNTHSFFSFHYGAMSVKTLLETAQLLNIRKLALTDINNTSGCLEFIRQSSKFGIEPVVGIDFRNGILQQFVALACNEEGFFEINRYLSHFLENEIPIPDRAPAFNHVLVVYPFSKKINFNLRDNEWIGIRRDEIQKFKFSAWKIKTHKCVAMITSTFRNKKDFNAHRLLRAMQQNTLLSKLSVNEQANCNDLFVDEKSLLKIYEEFPALLENAQKLLNACSIKIEFGKSKNKLKFTNSTSEDIELLKKLSYAGIPERYAGVNEEIEARVAKEIELICKQGFCAYFLINWDIVRLARHKGFYYVGRGSGANSIVAYLLKITDVDPIELDLYFERFMNEFRVNPPDFDLDFSWKDRDEIIAYIFKKHGRQFTAQLGTYTTMQTKAVLRDLGKVFGLPKAEIDGLREQLFNKTKADSITQLIYKYSEYIFDFPRHLGIHAGGIIISEKPIHYYTATSIPPKGFPLTQFSMLEAEDVGLYKFDILSQRGLGHIKDAVQIVKKNQGIDIDIHAIPAFKKDPKIKYHLKNAKAIGCFYVESPAMRMLLKKLEAETYLDLVAASSIIRPGVAQSGMMREYILRARDPERRNYIHPKMQELMAETYGIMVYQEDVIKVAHYFAGLTLAEADVLRRGMSGKFRGREEFHKAKEQFIAGCVAKGYPDAITFEVWRQIESFAGYSFSKGHSASYAVESYQSLYLKAYFPMEFMVGVINNFGGFYKTEFYVHEARMSGATIHPPCVNNSEFLTCIYGSAIYLGFIHMAELEQKTAQAIHEERFTNGPFTDLADFTKRVSISVEQLRLLIRIGAFRFTGRTRKVLLWDILSILGNEKKSIPKSELFETPVTQFQLPQLTYDQFEDALDQIAILGFPIVSPFTLINPELLMPTLTHNLMQFVGQVVEITGYYVCYKPTRTVKGDNMYFGTFIDQKGDFFDTVHFPPVAMKYPFKGSGCYHVQGKVTQEFGFPSIEVIVMKKIELRKEVLALQE